MTNCNPLTQLRQFELVPNGKKPEENHNMKFLSQYVKPLTSRHHKTKQTSRREIHKVFSESTFFKNRGHPSGLLNQMLRFEY